MAKSKELSDDFLAELKDAFGVYDKDGTGSIALKDVSPLFRSLGVSIPDNEIAEMTKKCKGGVIFFPEFCVIVTNMMVDNTSELELREAFRVFDRDNSGTINLQDFLHIMETSGDKLSKEELEELARDADTQGNGKIRYEEYIRMMLSS